MKSKQRHVPTFVCPCSDIAQWLQTSIIDMQTILFISNKEKYYCTQKQDDDSSQLSTVEKQFSVNSVDLCKNRKLITTICCNKHGCVVIRNLLCNYMGFGFNSNKVCQHCLCYSVHTHL